MLMPDLEMGYANQEEAIPALSGPAAHQTGTFCSLLCWLCCVHPTLVLLHAIQAHICLAGFKHMSTHAAFESINASVRDDDIDLIDIDAVGISR